MRVVVSLSTVPSRVRDLGRAVNNILDQTYAVDRVYVNLPLSSIRQGIAYPSPPSWMANHPRVHVNRCEDRGPVTKLAPTLALETDPDTLIVTIDDDIVYRADRVACLVAASEKRPDAAIGGAGFIVGDWWRLVGTVKRPSKDTPVDVIEGYSACIYRRGFFGDDIRSPVDAPPSLFYHDDVLISATLATRGVNRIVHRDAGGPYVGNSGYGGDVTTDDGLSSNTLTFVRQILPPLYYYRHDLTEPQVMPMHKTVSGVIIIAVVLIGLAFLVYGLAR